MRVGMYHVCMYKYTCKRTEMKAEQRGSHEVSNHGHPSAMPAARSVL